MRMASIAVLMLAACGGDEGGGGGGAGAAKPAAKKPAAAKKAKTETLVVPMKVEDRVTQAERDTIRHRFGERDFAVDPQGVENRDPFRSFVVAQIGLGRDASNDPQGDVNCDKDRIKAPNYSLRDLRLVGIIARGVRSYALFQDTADVGHVVVRGDCVGRERARVKSFGSALVTLEIVPEFVPGQPERPPEERSIPLYADELPISTREPGDTGEGSAPSAPLPSMGPP